MHILSITIHHYYPHRNESLFNRNNNWNHTSKTKVQWNFTNLSAHARKLIENLVKIAYKIALAQLETKASVTICKTDSWATESIQKTHSLLI